MKLALVRSLRFGATALHRLASILNERAYRLDHAGKGVVVHVSPLAGLLAEVRQGIRDRELDPAKRCKQAFGVDGGEVAGQLRECAAHNGSRHSFADAVSVDTHPLYSEFTKFLDERLKPGTLQPRDARGHS